MTNLIKEWTHTAIPDFKVRPYQQEYFYEKPIEYIRQQMMLAKQIPNYTPEPAFLNASVGTGKSLAMAMLAKHVSDRGGRMMILANQGELVEQNSEEAWGIGCRNGIYSASLNRKNKLYPVLIGTIGTVANGIQKDASGNADLDDWGVPDIIALDENHNCPWDDHDSLYMRTLAHFYRLNPRLVVIGLTGSPFRGIEPILTSDADDLPPEKRGFVFSRRNVTHQFWKHQLCNISTEWAIEQGYLVPPMFGFPPDDDTHYGYDGIEPSRQTGDYTEADLDRVASEQSDKLPPIIDDIVYRTRDRNVVLIFAASKRHCKQIQALLPQGQSAVIHEGTAKKKRADYIAAAKTFDKNDPKSGYTSDGKTRVKYLINVGTLTTGVNIKPIDCVVYLRAVGSLTLLIQSIGRGLRLCDWIGKKNALILDYAEVMVRLGSLYSNPILEQAELERSKSAGNTKLCPKCNTENGEFARRCCAPDESAIDGRCEYFFESIECSKCGVENDIVARECRSCGAELRDPNEKLVGKAYTGTDWKPVESMTVGMTKAGDGIIVQYRLPDNEVGKEILHPSGKKPWQRAKWSQFVKDHINCKRMRAQFNQTVKAPKQVVARKAMLDVPTHITHRVNEKGFSIIHNKQFRSGRVANGKDD